MAPKCHSWWLWLHATTPTINLSWHTRPDTCIYAAHWKSPMCVRSNATSHRTRLLHEQLAAYGNHSRLPPWKSPQRHLWEGVYISSCLPSFTGPSAVASPNLSIFRSFVRPSHKINFCIIQHHQFFKATFIQNSVRLAPSYSQLRFISFSSQQ